MISVTWRPAWSTEFQVRLGYLMRTPSPKKQKQTEKGILLSCQKLQTPEDNQKGIKVKIENTINPSKLRRTKNVFVLKNVKPNPISTRKPDGFCKIFLYLSRGSWNTTGASAFSNIHLVVKRSHTDSKFKPELADDFFPAHPKTVTRQGPRVCHRFTSALLPALTVLLMAFS